MLAVRPGSSMRRMSDMSTHAPLLKDTRDGAWKNEQDLESSTSCGCSSVGYSVSRVGPLRLRSDLTEAATAALEARDASIRIADGLMADGARVFTERRDVVCSLRRAANALLSASNLLFEESQQDVTWVAS